MKVIAGTVNWGIIGCGDVCEVKSGPAFQKINDSRLVAVMRRDLSKAADFAKRHGVPRFYDSVPALINDPEVNAIYIATPPAYHEPYLEAAMKAGKPVYIEKPVTINAAACERMVAVKNQYGQRATVAHYRRGLPLFKKLKSLLAGGVIGNVRLIRIATWQPEKSKIITQTEDHWRVKPELSGGGLFHDLSPHQLDILYWIFGSPRKVTGRSFNQAKQYKAPDLAQIEAVFEGDICLQGTWAFNVAESATQDCCEIVGDQGMLRFAFFRKSSLEIITDHGSETHEFDYPVNIQLPMIEQVVSFFKGEDANPCTLEEALEVMKMIDATV